MLPDCLNLTCQSARQHGDSSTTVVIILVTEGSQTCHGHYSPLHPLQPSPTTGWTCPLVNMPIGGHWAIFLSE